MSARVSAVAIRALLRGKGAGGPSHARRRTVFVTGLLALLSVTVFLATTASADTSFGEEETPQAGFLRNPKGIAVDNTAGPSGGDLYVGDVTPPSTGQIDKFGPTGNSLFAFGWGAADGSEEEQTCTVTCTHISQIEPESVEGGLLTNPWGLAVDPSSGDLYVVDRGYGRIEKFDSEGHFLFSFGGDVVAHGPDNSANDEKQLVTVKAEGGTFKLEFQWSYSETFAGGTPRANTLPLPYNATAAEVETALNALSTISGVGGSVSVTGGPGDATGSHPYEITFEGNLGGDDVRPLLAISEEGEPPISTLTGATHSVEVETLANGGGPEVCKLTSGDTCKAGGDRGSGLNGTFSSFGQEHSPPIAVGTTSTVYVGDTDRVQEFDPEGSYTGEITIPGGGGTQAVAVDGPGDVYVISENVSGVQEFDSEGHPVRTVHPEGEPGLLATDSSGDLFVGTELHRGEPDVAYEFAEYDAAGNLVAEFHSTLLKAIRRFEPENTFIVNGIAVADSTHQLYATNLYKITTDNNEPRTPGQVVAIPLPTSGPPAVTAEHVSDTEPTTATLHALVNPRGHDTEYHFEYVDQHNFETEGGFSSPHTQSTPTVDLGLINREDPVQAAISPLTPETTYHYRAVAESSAGITEPEAEFETLPPVSVRDLTTQTVAPELVTLKAELNPNGSATHYTVRYGTGAGYACEPGNTCAAEGSIPIGNEFVKLEADGKEGITFTGLQPNTEYHYQLVAENGYGLTKTLDQAFTTELSAAEERAAEDCPNTNLREEDSALALPDCRDYEQVSPAYKAGYSTTHGSWLAPGGERVLYESIGAFAGAIQDTPPIATQYLAQRTASGWITQAVIANPAGPGFVPQVAFQFSPELDRWIFQEAPGFSFEATAFREVPSGALYMGHADGTYSKASPTISHVEPTAYPFMDVFSASDDLSHIFIGTVARDLPSDLRPTDSSTFHTRMYEVAGADGPSPTMKLLAEVPLSLSPDPAAKKCWFDQDYTDLRGRLTSGDGSTIVYTLPIEEHAGAPCGEGEPNPIGLYAHVGEAAPIQLNVALPSQCHSPSPCATAATAVPRLLGVSPAGSRVWFTTTQPLVDSDTDSTRDLYLVKLENGHLTELTQASKGEPGPGTADGTGAGVQGIVQVSGDGSHVAFVATGVLTTEPNSTGASAAQGADNLYLYDAQSGQTRFVARLCKGPEESGSLVDPQCPAAIGAVTFHQNVNDSSLWEREPAEEAQLTPDGGFLLFSSFGRLASGDTDNVQDIYRYDFSTGQLIRLSFGRDGNDGNGNDDAYGAELPGIQGATSPQEIASDRTRAVSADGSTVIFKTTAPLVSHDTDLGPHPGCGSQETGCDLYQWQESGHGTCAEAGGCVSLVSDGLDPHGVFGGNISSSGRDITFYTQRGEVPADTDGVGDVYDARENGGFHYTHPPISCASSEICHNAPGSEPTPPKITEGETGGNGPQQLQCAKGKVRVKKHGQVRCVAKKHHKKHKRAASAHRGGNK